MILEAIKNLQDIKMECDPKEVRKCFICLEMNSSYSSQLKILTDLGRNSFLRI